MSLHDRIMAKLESVKDAEEMECVPETLAYNQGIKQAAQIAKEADELMAEMVKFLQCCNFDNNTDMREADALVKKYKEQTK